MSKLTILCAAGCSLLALNLACSWSTAKQEQVQQPNVGTEGECSAPDLAYLEIVGIAERGVRALGGDVDDLRRRFTISVSNAGCNYLFLAVPTSETAGEEPLSMIIDRSGRITSWPWCCVPGIFVPPTEKP